MATRKRNVMQLVTKGKPVPAVEIARLEMLLEQARSGEVTSFAFVAIGPDMWEWQGGHLATLADRFNLIGQLAIARRLIEDQIIEARERE
jgi:hypothetical protein